MMARRLLTLAALGVAYSHSLSLPAASCSLKSLAISAIAGIKILATEVQSVTNYTFINPDVANATAADFFDFCNVTVVYTHPGWNDRVNLITYLPEDWNGRFLAVGGAGMAAGGEALLHLLPTITPLLKRKFAISTTDGGRTVAGRVLRSDNLQTLTPEDVRVLVEEIGRASCRERVFSSV